MPNVRTHVNTIHVVNWSRCMSSTTTLSGRPAVARCLKVRVHEKLELPVTFHECCTREFGGTLLPSCSQFLPHSISMKTWMNYETHIFKKWGYVLPTPPTALPMLTVRRIHYKIQRIQFWWNDKNWPSQLASFCHVFSVTCQILLQLLVPWYGFSMSQRPHPLGYLHLGLTFYCALLQGYHWPNYWWKILPLPM